MALDKRMRELCEQVLTCTNDPNALTLLEELRTALHIHIEEVRGKVIVLPPLGSDAKEASGT